MCARVVSVSFTITCTVPLNLVLAFSLSGRTITRTTTTTDHPIYSKHAHTDIPTTPIPSTTPNTPTHTVAAAATGAAASSGSEVVSMADDKFSEWMASSPENEKKWEQSLDDPKSYE
jgi:hypothetical protein